MGRRLESIEEWHRLFDALCMERGHVDNGSLASDYCALTRKRTDGAHETALKSLNNWRQGVHVPNRRNFRLLTLLLQIEDGDDILPHWHRLYEEAQRRKPSNEQGNDKNGDATDLQELAPRITVGASRRSRRWPIAAVIAVAIVLVGGMGIGLIGWQKPEPQVAVRKKPEAGEPVIDMTGERIYWRELSEVRVGESVVIHAKRGRCGEQPPSWEETFEYLPELATGIWSDGGVGFRISRSCGGATPARAVVFTATRPGEERFMLYEDQITIRVDE